MASYCRAGHLRQFGPQIGSSWGMEEQGRNVTGLGLGSCSTGRWVGGGSGEGGGEQAHAWLHL